MPSQSILHALAATSTYTIDRRNTAGDLPAYVSYEMAFASYLHEWNQPRLSSTNRRYSVGGLSIATCQVEWVISVFWKLQLNTLNHGDFTGNLPNLFLVCNGYLRSVKNISYFESQKISSGVSPGVDLW